ncbi:MFS transporter [Demequina sp.]|uniref:MFS transporter n=1 Tax=Demequina sp. TaxID=2050685 RepID=UPI003D117134
MAESVLPASVNADSNRWRMLAVIAVAQLMIVLDGSIVNVALPHMQQDLGISDANRQWVVTAYILTFGSLLLLGGRIADYWGRKRAFVVGLIGFAFASALGGFAPSQGYLFAARGLQGIFAALLAPAALSLVTVAFTEPKERAKAFGVFGALSGAGAAIGLILGGLLTDNFGWEWVMWVNVPIAAITAVFAVIIVHESKAGGHPHFDIPGALLATFGLLALVYGFTRVSEVEHGWADPSVIALLAAAAILLVGFVLMERRSPNPLLPLRIPLDRVRGGSYLTFLVVGAGLTAMFLFLGFYLQIVLGYSALKAGMHFLPFSVVIILTAGVVARVLPKVGPRPLMVAGLLIAAVGMLLLLRTTPEDQYWTHVFPSMVIIPLGMAFVFIPTSSTALIGVEARDAGVASALLNTSQQVGGSIGLALLSTLALTAQANSIDELGLTADGYPHPESLVAGYHVGYLWGAVLLVIGALIAFALVRVKRHEFHASAEDEAPALAI